MSENQPRGDHLEASSAAEAGTAVPSISIANGRIAGAFSSQGEGREEKILHLL